MRARIFAGGLLALVLAAPAAADQVTLEGRAVLPARTFAPGPISGTLLGSDPINGVLAPFPGQPVQGFSAVLDAGRGRYWAMADNGFGAEDNSKDFLLRAYRITPDFATARGGDGTIKVGRCITLRDPDRHVPFALERGDRQLTGGDFDIESMRIDARGDLWFGDEFGPWLLHTDATRQATRAADRPARRPVAAEPAGRAVQPEPDAQPLQRFEGMALGTGGVTCTRCSSGG